jgi:hypothetical protein
MAYLFRSCFSDTLVTCLTTIAFTAATLTPPSLKAANPALDFGAINFGIKIEKIYEKIKKSIGTCKAVLVLFSHF